MMVTIALVLGFLAFTTVATPPNPYSHCDISVVGAGWGGAYFAYRTTLSPPSLINASKPAWETLFDPSQVCIFEQSTRIGGRAYRWTHNVPNSSYSWGDLSVDLGAYRYGVTQQLVKGVVESILGLPTICYNGYCDATTGYRVIADQYGNNGGYARAVEGLINKFVQAGGNVYYGHKLVNIKQGPGNKINLVFANGAQVPKALQVVLDLPSSAIAQLQTTDNILYTKGSTESEAAIVAPGDIKSVKQFIWYEDAWWLTKLNLTAGEAYGPWGGLPPISARYGDGAVKCVTSTLPNGTKVYAPARVPGGNCEGALLSAYVEFDDSSFNWYLDNWVTLAERAVGQIDIFIKRGDSRESLLDLTHQQLMIVHNDSLWAAGINPATIAPPTSTVLAIWNSAYNPTYPAWYNYMTDYQAATYTTDNQYQLRNLAMKPLKNFDLFIGNEAYSMGGGWAEGSLTMVERILGLKGAFEMEKPPWVTSTYWKQLVIPYLTLPKKKDPVTGEWPCTNDSQCVSSNNCVTGECSKKSCVWAPRTGQSCNQDNGCNLNTVCSYSAMCYGPAVTCPVSGDVCVGGSCKPNAPPPLPACKYTNPFGPLIFYWQFTGTGSIHLAYQLPGVAFSAFGIASSLADSMINSDIVIAATLNDGTIQVKDYWSAQKAAPFLDTDIGGQNSLTDIWIASGGYGDPKVVYWTRQVNTGDSKDLPIVNGTMNFIYAWSDDGFPGTIGYHQSNRKVITVDLSVCNP